MCMGISLLIEVSELLVLVAVSCTTLTYIISTTQFPKESRGKGEDSQLASGYSPSCAEMQ